METIEAWKCIGCGNIEAPQTCIGVCQYRKVQLVDALEHERVVRDLRDAQQRQRVYDALLRRLACTTPRDGQWERSYRHITDRGTVCTKRRFRVVNRAGVRRDAGGRKRRYGAPLADRQRR
jgi:hypothetical protein